MISIRKIKNLFKKKDKKYKSDIEIKSDVYSQSSIYSFSDIGGCIIHSYFKYEKDAEKDLNIFVKLLSKLNIKYIHLEDKNNEPILFISSDNNELDYFLYNIFFNESLSSVSEDNVFIRELLRMLVPEIDKKFFPLCEELFSEVVMDKCEYSLNKLDDIISDYKKMNEDDRSNFILSILGSTKPNKNIWDEYNIDPTIFNINGILSECYMDLVASPKFFSMISESFLYTYKVTPIENSLLYYIRVNVFDFCKFISINGNLFDNILNILRTNNIFAYPEKPYYIPMSCTSNNNIYDYWIGEINIAKDNNDNDESLKEGLYSEIDEIIS